jgi:hypothetical protein
MRPIATRPIVSAFTAVCLLASQSAFAAAPCASASDQAAFDVQALRSELVVLATGCHDDEDYNAFVRRFQPDLQANERQISTYFQHRYGRNGQTEHDRFVTDLANAMSRAGSDIGSDFCPRNGEIFHEVMALSTASQLTDYAAGKNLMPTSIAVCTVMPTNAVAERRATAKRATAVRKAIKR